MDYRSLEHKIRDVMIAETEARNTAIRKKVANVGRPDDNVKDETSKLAKQGEIKTKIIDEASDVDTDGAFMKDKDKVSKKKPNTQDEDDPREIKGGKTAIDLKPTTNDNTEDSTKEDKISKTARNKVNKEIGAKGVKEETMTGKLTLGSSESLINSIAEAMKSMKAICPKCKKAKCMCEAWKEEAELEEKLIGGQKKIDANHNGKIDAQDFKILKGKKKVEEETVEEGNANLIKKIEKQKSKAVKKGFDYPSQDPKTADRKTLTSFHKEIKKFNKEEVEEINELDRDGMVKRYADKTRKQVEGGEKPTDYRAAGRLMAGKKRHGGVGGIPAAKVPAVTREEVEELDERDAANKAKKDAAAMAFGAKNRDEHHNAKRGMRTDVADKIRGREVMQGKPRVRYEEVELSTEELARIEEIANNLDEVVTARKLTPADKAARAKYLEGHAAKMAGMSHHAIKGDAKSFKARNTEHGDYSKEPSKMAGIGLDHTLTKQDTKR